MKYRDTLIVLLLLALFFLQAVNSMRLKSPTWDETSYFGLGYYLGRNQTWDVPAATLHPPLSYYANSIPYLFYDADNRAWDLPPELKGEEASNLSFPLAGLKLLTDKRYPQDQVLFCSRIPTILIALLLGFFVWKWARELSGTLSAALVLLLFSFSPNILAHARLITPDLMLTCFTFIAVYYLWKVVMGASWSSILLCSLALGCALLSKYSALLLFPIYMILLVFVFFSQEKVPLPDNFPCSGILMKGGSGTKLLRLATLMLIISFLALCLVYLGYLFHPENYLKGVVHQLAHAERGHPTFLMGMYSTEGWWYYYPIAFLLKTPLPLLVLLVLSLLSYKKHPRSLDHAFLLVPVVVFFLFFSIKLLCVGLRYVLPVYPFVFVLAGMTVSYRLKEPMKVVMNVVVAALCGWFIISSLAIYPHYLAYFNEAAGGPDEGYNYLVDSNLDWGQDLKGLGEYMNKKGIEKVHLSYFGAADPRYYNIDYEWMPSYYLPDDYGGDRPGDRVFRFPRSGIVAISATNLQNVYFSDKTFYDWLKEYTPIDKIGYSLFIYDLDRSMGSEHPSYPHK
jgi:4-amino-4-deoxy-L-arabinose transferase-like glycosyltransferase